MEVIAWQLGIFFSILLATLIFGSTGWVLSILIAIVWTAVKIFTSWLMALQFVTIIFAALAAFAIHEKFRSISQQARAQLRDGLAYAALVFFALAIIGGIYFVHRFNPLDFRLDLYALGLATGYAAALFASAVVGGAAIWLAGGIGWKSWSIQNLEVGGLVSIFGVALILIAGQEALQRFVSQDLNPWGSKANEQANSSSAPKPTAQLVPKEWRPSSEKYGAVVREYEAAYPIYDPTGSRYDAKTVRETLHRQAFYIFVDHLGEVEALRAAVKDMLLPASSRPSIQIEASTGGRCRYYKSGNRQIVAIDGHCPVLDLSAGLRQ